MPTIKDNLKQHRAQCLALFERLNEQERRHVAGLLALLAGHGGIEWVAQAVGLQRECVARGKSEVAGELKDRPKGRQRLPGGGRKPIEKKVPNSSKRSRRSSPKTQEQCRQESENSSD